MTVSKPAVSSATGMPRAVAALKIRAPSRCTGRPAFFAPAQTCSMTSRGVTVPPAMLWEFSRQIRPVRARLRLWPVIHGCDAVPGENAAIAGDGAQLAAGEGGGHGHLPIQNVGERLADDLLAGLGVNADGDLVAHGAGGNEEGGFPAEDLGGAGFEAVDGGVFGVHIVADLGLGHGGAHGGSGLGDGVTAQVDDAGVEFLGVLVQG